MNSRLIYRTLLAILFAVMLLPTAQGEESEKEVFFNKEQWQEVTENADYSEYYKEKEAPKVKEKKRKDFNFKPLVRAEVIKPILIVIIIGILSFVLYLILKNSFNFFSEKVPDQQLSKVVEELEENIHEADFNALLRKALESNQLKLAVRIYYLHTIKVLSDKNLIQWKRNKTNGQYVRELSGHERGSDFSFITSVYEQVWFSTHPIDHKNYQAISEHLTKFMGALK